MRTAVVLAHNWANTGMYTVDLSAFRVFESLGLPVDYFAASGARPGSLFKSGQVPIYRISDAGTLRAYDNVVYWGDFTTSPYYAVDDLCVQLNSYEGPVSRHDAFLYWIDIFLLRQAKRPDQRLFSFCQNFQTLSVSAPKVNFEALRPLYERFSRIMPRDTVSTGEIAKHFPSVPAEILHQGCDAAFLLPDGTATPRDGGSRKVGVFLERSKIENKQELMHAIARQGYEPISLGQWLALPRNRFHENFLHLTASIAGCACVVTDTYHLAVNAIRIGTTPIVLGADEDAQTSTVSDFKKRVMLRDLDAEDLYVPIKDARLSEEQMARMIDRVAELADGHHPVHARSQAAANKMQGEIRQALLG